MKEQYEIHWTDYYDLLQVTPTAETEVIEGAYKQLMLKYHPDRNGSGSNAKVRLLNEAKEVLRDPARRGKYDQAYSLHLEQASPAPRPTKRIQQARKRLRQEPPEDPWLSKIRKPHILVSPSELVFSQCAPGQTRVKDLLVRVTEGRAVVGEIIADRPWIKLSTAELFSVSEVIQVVVDTGQLAIGRTYNGAISIKTVLYGGRVVPVMVQMDGPAVVADNGPEYWKEILSRLRAENKEEQEFLYNMSRQLAAKGWRPSAKQMGVIERMKNRLRPDKE